MEHLLIKRYNDNTGQAILFLSPTECNYHNKPPKTHTQTGLRSNKVIVKLELQVSLDDGSLYSQVTGLIFLIVLITNMFHLTTVQ